MSVNEEQLDRLKELAEEGEADFQYQLGAVYNSGRGVTQDYKSALEWYMKAAEQGHNKAQFSLGLMYYKGKGVEQDYEQAKYWFEKAAMQGNDDASDLVKEIGGKIAEQNAEKKQESPQPERQTNILRDLSGNGSEGNNSTAPKDKVNRSVIAFIVIGLTVTAGLLCLYFSDLQTRANWGFAGAQAQLGSNYEQGMNGYRKDAARAEYWYRQAAQKGHIEAQYNLGIMYYYGRGVAQNYTQAFFWHRRAAEQGHMLSQNYLGYMYQYGQGIIKNEVEAVNWYRKAAEQGNIVAQNNLGIMYQYGRGTEQEYSEAVKYYQLSAANGYAPAQNNLGWMYEQGLGVSRSYSEAVRLYRLSAEQGYSYGQNNLGRAYEFGLGVTMNYDIAKSWYEKAAAQGLVLAQDNLRRLHEKMNPPQPQEYLPEAKEAKVLTPQELYTQGTQYLNAKNYSEALKFYRESAAQDYAPAQDKIGYMYQKGWGVKRNYSEAFTWYKKAAEQGNHEAQASLGLLYYKGWGVSKDLQKALYWYKKSADQGNPSAKSQYNKIQLEISSLNKPESPYRSDYYGTFPVSGTITGNNVHFRVSPDTASDSIRYLYSGNRVSISQKSSESDGDWFRIRTTDGTEGWVFGRYVNIEY